MVVEGESAAGRSLRCVESRATSCPTLTRRMPQPCRLPSIISPTYVSLPSCCTCQRLRLPLLVGGEDRAEAGWPMRLPPTAGSSSYAQNLWRKADRELTPKRSNMAAHIGGRLGGSHFRTAHAHDGARAFAHRRPPARPSTRLTLQVRPARQRQSVVRPLERESSLHSQLLGVLQGDGALSLAAGTPAQPVGTQPVGLTKQRSLQAAR